MKARLLLLVGACLQATLCPVAAQPDSDASRAAALAKADATGQTHPDHSESPVYFSISKPNAYSVPSEPGT